MSTRFLRLCLLAVLATSLTLVGCAKKNKTEEFSEEAISWPPPPDKPVIRWTGHIASSKWVAPPTPIQVFLARLTGRSEVHTFKKPYQVTSDDAGRVYVSDTGWGRVMVFDRANKKFSWLGDTGQGALQKPAGLTTDSRGHIYVSDLTLGRVLEYDPDFNFLRAMGGGVLVRPVGVAVNEQHKQIWVVDSKRHSVEIFSQDGTHVKTVGGRGSEEGQFNYPTNIVTARHKDEIYISDTFNFRIQVFDGDGEFVRSWGKNCDSFGCFARAKGLAVDGEDNVFVVDAAFNNVQMFDKEGSLLMFFGGVGNGPGQLWLPAGMHIAKDGTIYVVSQYNWRVNTYEYLGAPDYASVQEE